MQVFLEAVQFNHDSKSATGDAFNIRRNETKSVSIPEWQRGVSFKPEDSPAAYAIRETRGSILTIKAQFKSTGFANDKMQVRAVEARQRPQKLGCGPIGSLLRAVSSVRPAPAGNILGEVKESQVEFNQAGETGFETFELQNVQLWYRGVSVSNTEWRWQFRANQAGRWRDFALTKHRIYSVLEIPNCPWQQTPHEESNTQLPWADALEYVCDWAAGAENPDEAATLITRNIYDLGLVGLVEYLGSSFYSCPNFNCTKFLDLLGGGFGAGHRMNCSDCAAAVSSFANLVGCNLRQLQLGPGSFTPNPIRLIGRERESSPPFSGHEVAWKGGVTDDGRVFDACLQLDGDSQPASPPFAPILPTNFRFGSVQDRAYRFRLNPEVFPLPGTLSCRNIGLSQPGGCDQDEIILAFLKDHYDFESWRQLQPNNNLDPSGDGFLGQQFLSQWTVELPVQRPKINGVVKAFQAIWVSPGDSEVLLRLDFFELERWQEAREFILLMLGEFSVLDVQRLDKPAIGDVSFADADHASVLFAQDKFVLLVRSAGRTPISVLETSIEAQNSILSLAAL